jgi:site-specific recombinase XerC
VARKQGERGKQGHLVGSELLVYESIKKWISSLEKSAVSKGKLFTAKAKTQRLGRMMEYTKDGEINPDFLLQEAKLNIEDAGTRLQTYFQAKLKGGVEWNSSVTALCFLRGFYSHNDIVFPKRMRVPKRHISTVKKTDGKTEIYGYNEESDATIFRNGLLQHFFDNLSFRDQAIGLSIFSSGADAADILNLKIGFVKDARGNLNTAKRFSLHDNRLKDSIAFKTFFSAEATEYIRRYIQQERSNAKNDEYLFVKEDGEQIPVHALTMNFRTAAEKMGYIVSEETNPFRPKRFRSLFRTACGIANVDAGFTMAFMGHSSDMSASYLEKSNGLFLKEYIKVEPYLTVYGVDKSQIITVNENVDELKQEIQTLKEELVDLRTVVTPLIGIAEKQLRVYTRARDLHATTAPQLESKGSPLTKESREAEQYLTAEAAQLQKELDLAKQILNKNKKQA